MQMRCQSQHGEYANLCKSGCRLCQKTSPKKILCCGNFATTQYFFQKVMCCDKVATTQYFFEKILCCDKLATTQYFFKKYCVVAGKIRWQIHATKK